MPPRVAIEGERIDEISMVDVIQRVRLIHRAFENKGKKPGVATGGAGMGGTQPNLRGDKISFMSEIL